MGGALWRYDTQEEGCTNNSYIHSFIHSFIHLFIHSFIHALLRMCCSLVSLVPFWSCSCVAGLGKWESVAPAVTAAFTTPAVRC
jgi:hypothetical protein